ncbi:hypothetical protein BDV95DRAFT_567496 [Massariosphaeria phaeospora]|uniref:Uncharacterized protein n=1 Tax=Massariosphaeria phaeospora TaxID=100035 RepID=A0A7C8I8Z0_9PLEO|nr:hypothetical protein BDV95DRAFT_567496 [Massariosphaeria phaeospora]
MNETAEYRTTITSLPNELLLQIASHLELQPPSITKFAHKPSSGLTDAEAGPLKALSAVSWRWRKIVLPILFRYSRIALDREPQWVPIDARLIETLQSQLTKLSNHELQIYTRMRSRFKSTSMFAFNEAFDDVLITLCRIRDGDEFLKSVPHIHWLPHLPKSYADFGTFVVQHNLKNHIKSLVLMTEKEYELQHVVTAEAPLSRAVAEIWSQIFSCLEPSRVVVAAPPSTLAGLLDTQMLSSDTWAFDMNMHYIELVHDERTHIGHRNSSCRPWDTTLIHRKPWSHLGYNEGSSITAYSTYEYHLKQSPKILYLTLLRLAKETQDCCNIRSFSFIGVFPFGTNVTAIIRALHRVRTLRDVHFKLAPGLENDLLSTPGKMGRALPSDLWLEWSDCYKIIASFLGVYEFQDGSVFRSGDCEGDWSANEVESFQQLLPNKGAGWRKIELGVWARDHGQDEDLVPMT